MSQFHGLDEMNAYKNLCGGGGDSLCSGYKERVSKSLELFDFVCKFERGIVQRSYGKA